MTNKSVCKTFRTLVSQKEEKKETCQERCELWKECLITSFSFGLFWGVLHGKKRSFKKWLVNISHRSRNGRHILAYTNLFSLFDLFITCTVSTLLNTHQTNITVKLYMNRIASEDK